MPKRGNDLAWAEKRTDKERKALETLERFNGPVMAVVVEAADDLKKIGEFSGLSIIAADLRLAAEVQYRLDKYVEADGLAEAVSDLGAWAVAIAAVVARRAWINRERRLTKKAGKKKRNLKAYAKVWGKRRIARVRARLGRIQAKLRVIAASKKKR